MLSEKTTKSFYRWIVESGTGKDTFGEITITFGINSINIKKLSKSLLYALLIDFFDSVGIYISTNKMFEGFSAQVDGAGIYNPKNRDIVFSSRNEAASEAVEKANEKYSADTFEMVLFTSEAKSAIDWDLIKKRFNEITKKNTRVIPGKAKTQIAARLREGFTVADLFTAIENCYKDEFHVNSNHKNLTLEFISRSDKLDKFLNVKINTQENGKSTAAATGKKQYKFSAQRIIDNSNKTASVSSNEKQLSEN